MREKIEEIRIKFLNNMATRNGITMDMLDLIDEKSAEMTKELSNLITRSNEEAYKRGMEDGVKATTGKMADLVYRIQQLEGFNLTQKEKE